MGDFLKNTLLNFFSKERLDYFLSPKETGYDITKTLLYSILFVSAAYVIYKVIKKLKIRVDMRLAIAVSPYIIFGSCLRVVKDAGVVNSYFFVTPGIYVFVFSVFFVVTLIALSLQKKFKIEYYKPLFLVGIFLIPFTISQLNFPNLQALVIVIVLLIPWICLFKFVRWSTSNKVVSSLQMFDATTTFVAMSFFGYYEQHVVPTLFINIFGPISFVIVKLIVVVSVLYIIDNFYESKSIDKEFALYLKLIMGILGAATGTRDIISLAAGI